MSIHNSTKCTWRKVISKEKSTGSNLYFPRGPRGKWIQRKFRPHVQQLYGCGLPLRHESANAASNDGPADGAVTQAGGTVSAHDQVTTGDEDDGHQLVHAHLTGPFFLQLPKQLLRAGLCRSWSRFKEDKTTTQAQIMYKPTNFFFLCSLENQFSQSSQKTLFVNHKIDSDLSLWWVSVF